MFPRWRTVWRWAVQGRCSKCTMWLKVSLMSIYTCWFFTLMRIASLALDSCSCSSHDIWYQQGKMKKKLPQPLYGKREGSTKWSLKLLLALNFWSSPTPHNRHLLVSFILACFLIFSSFSPVWSSLFFSFFSSNVHCNCQGLPLEKPCLALLHYFTLTNMVPCWWPEGCRPWFMVPGALIYEFGEGRKATYLVTLNHHLFSSCLHWLSAWRPLVFRLSFLLSSP